MTLDGTSTRLVDSVDAAFDLMRWLSTCSIIALDTETTGLSPEHDRVRLVQLGDARQSYVVPFERWGGVIEDVVKRYRGQYIGHNMQYDVAMLDHEGIYLPRHLCHDTRLMAHILESTGSLALKNLAYRFVDERAAAGQLTLQEAFDKSGWNWSTVPIDFTPYWTYAGLDPIETYQLFEILHPRVMAEAPDAYGLELAVSWVCERMMRRGVCIDRAYTRQLGDQLHQYIGWADTWCARFNIRPGSNEEVVEALERDGVVFTKKTATGKYSVDKEVLSGIDHPLAQVILRRRQMQKMASTYIDNYLKLSTVDDVVGIIHPSINTVGGVAHNVFESGGSKGVRTGRMSMSDPNLQNVPRHTVAGNRIRDCFIPRPEHVWLKADFSQIEMRILAHLSKDDGLRQSFSSGDFFVNLARQIYEDPSITKSDPRRQVVKSSGYAKAYGGGVEKFAETASISVEAASKFLQRFDIMYPGVRQFQRDIESEAQRHANEEGVLYVRSPLTNRRHVADPGRAYALVNYLIQGTAAEVLKIKMIEADQAGFGEWMTLPVHDEIDMDVPLDNYQDAVHVLRAVMNDDTMLSVPITSSIEAGKRWGTLEEL